ncbi:unnamed protein product [Rotaria sp. Silwood1]|nr:unnamed protein product [Rotaria sp. Silwood1]
MYTLLLKEALLDIEDDNKKSIKELAEYCRLQSDASEATIKKLEEGYGDHSPIWWYTGRYFIYSMLSYGLRLMKVEIILKMGFFIRHLHQDIQNLYDEQKAKNMIMDSPYKVYRGQGLSVQDFEIMKKCQGQLMSFNNFLSTSLDRDVSLDFAQAALKDTDTVGILFHMIIDPVICEELKIPFGDVCQASYFKAQRLKFYLQRIQFFELIISNRLIMNIQIGYGKSILLLQAMMTTN